MLQILWFQLYVILKEREERGFGDCKMISAAGFGGGRDG